MTLRTRLVLALVAMSTVGLAVFGVVTYSLYQRSLEDRLDDQLRSAVGPLSIRLTDGLFGVGRGPFPTIPDISQGEGPPSYGGGPSFDTYGAILDAKGVVLATSDPLVTDSRPDLSADLRRVRTTQLSTTGSASGPSQWRLLAQPLDIQSQDRRGSFVTPESLDGAVMVVAVPTADLQDQMKNLLKIEVTAALALLTALGGGAWLVLRRGLHPLEAMASSASTITTGDLSVRVTPADDRTEVGQLGLALNTMLDGIEMSFREREATERRLRQFLADASHELRTPLTSIQGFAELFRLGHHDDRLDLPVILRRIEEESHRMKGLVEDLLLLARLDETRPFEPEPVDLAVLAADACTDAVAVDPTRAVTLDAPTPVVVPGDAAHLRQAIANLVTNALRHTPPGSPIEVSTRLDGDRASVTVRDHGPGLDEVAIAHAFDRFWQADAARVGTGSGLGLAIVGGIAEEHGGTAHASNAPGGGAEVSFTVALALPTDPR